jgi:lipopolysaccharide exporter
VRQLKLINFKSDLFVTAACFTGQALLKFCSSLTRILQPSAYGTIAILISIAFVVEMIGDMNVTLFIVRDKNAESPRYLNTAWTMRLIRALINAAIVFLAAPVISSYFYHTPGLKLPLRVFSLLFVLGGLESMSFPLAVRRKQARWFVLSELSASILSTAFAIAYSFYSRDYWGMVYGTLLNRGLIACFSYCLYRDSRPALALDWGAAREILQFTKFTMPSSILTLILSQFDKIVLLRLFDLRLLGVYGLAANVAGLVESLINRISQTVLYPRCAHNFRNDSSTARSKYYSENKKLFASMLLLPAVVGGAAPMIVGILYPQQYSLAGPILQALMLRAVFLSLASSSEDLLIASGEPQVILVGNVFRGLGLFGGSWLGFHFLGFIGFVFGIAISGLPPLIYYFGLQRLKGLLIARYELYRVLFVAALGAASYAGSILFMHIWPNWRS